MPRPRIPDLQGPEAFIHAVRDSGSNLKQKFKNDPLGLATMLGLKLPMKPAQRMVDMGVITQEEAIERFGPIYPGLRDMVVEVCSLEVKSAVAVSARGAGKSQSVSFIEFFLWMLKDFDALNLGGSELQAANVYDYLVGYVQAHAEWKNLIQGDMKVSESKTKQNNWIKVLTASSKSVRSPHAGGVRLVRGQEVERGGLLVIDEEAECDEDIVAAALPTINTARPSVNVRSSTFHNESGSFATVVDHAEEMGYKTYRWDVFDVCAGCNCVGDTCQSEEICFREDHYENVVDPETGNVERKMKHKAYCGGRAKYADGWVPMVEIETLWKRTRRNHDKFEIEQMGSRPGSKGYVIKDRVKFRGNIIPGDGSEEYKAGFPVSICVDWGSLAAGVSVWQALDGDRHLLVYAELVEDAGVSQIISKIVELHNKYIVSVTEIAADIGGGGNYLNPYLKELGYNVRDVPFAEQKESAVAAMNIYSEASKILIPSEYREFIEQIDKWKRVSGRIAKGNDHLCDTAVCYFAKFAAALGVNKIRVPPKSFSSLPSSQSLALIPESPQGKKEKSLANHGRLRAPVAVTFGRR